MERIIGKNNKGFMVYDLPVIGVLEENDRVEKVLEKTVTKSPNLEVGINVESLESEQILNKNLKRSMPK
jgi:hypothetical protein